MESSRDCDADDADADDDDNDAFAFAFFDWFEGRVLYKTFLYIVLYEVELNRTWICGSVNDARTHDSVILLFFPSY